MPKTVTPSITNGDVTFPHSPSHLNRPIPTVFLEELVLSCPISFELSHSLPWSKPFTIVSHTENSSCSACGHLLQDLNHLFLDCLASKPLCNSWSKPFTIVSHTENSSCSACGHLLQDLNHLFLDCLASKPLCNSTFGSAACTLACGKTISGLPAKNDEKTGKGK